MINVDRNRLNPLESRIHATLVKAVETDHDIRISRAAELCGCSRSKISKHVKKLGFKNYRQYMGFMSGNETPPPEARSSELERIGRFIADFDAGMVDQLVTEINAHEKIILFGYGPSFICGQYFEYKLRIVTSKYIVTIQDEIMAENFLDERSLVIVFSATGKFKSFQSLYECAKARKSKFLLIAEEYNPALLSDYENIMFLTHETQADGLLPYEKSRILFFILIEEVILRFIIGHKKEKEPAVADKPRLC
jgi:DNA-binding MurR/RpiR family transcriptional regulator